jgi:KaiC/GvpD/RAD55 family RecA-like ATPase
MMLLSVLGIWSFILKDPRYRFQVHCFIMGAQVTSSKTEHVPTGIIGLDSLLGGGYPRSRVILISGGPGSGKTLMSMQFLVDGVERFDEKGIFVSLEESKYHLTNEMANYGWDLAKYEKKNQIVIVDASPLRQAIKESNGEESATDDLSESEKEVHVMGPRFSIQALSTVVRTFARTTHATRIAIDPITSLSLQFEETSQRRSAIIDLFDSLSSLGTTSLVTSEIGTHFGYSMTQREIPPEEYLSHGAIVLHNTHVHGKGIVSLLEIEKMRECKHDRQLHPYSITEKGVNVYAEKFLD